MEVGGGMGDANDPLSDVAKILDSEPVKNLFSPVTREVGEFLGTIAGLGRFYATRNLEKIFKEWAQSRRGERVLTSEEFEKILPLLPTASMVGDPELQKKWAVLMENTATQEGSLPSFGQTLSQLTAEEARYLDDLWNLVSRATDVVSLWKPGMSPLSYGTMVNAFDPTINTGINTTEVQVLQFTDEQKANYQRLNRAQLVIDDLVRLGIIIVEQIVEPDNYMLVGGRKFPFERSRTVLKAQYSFGQYGASFMKAVTPKQSEFVENAEEQ
jgi:hypothetical protein